MMDRLAEVLVRYSTAVRPGEVVRLLALPESEPLLEALSREIRKAGGHPVLARKGQSAFDTPLTLIAGPENPDPERVDVAIFVIAAMDAPAIPAADQAVEQRSVMDRFLRRAAERSLRWSATLFPTPAAARAAGLSPAAFTDLAFRASQLHRPDPAAAWRALEIRQGRLIEELAQARELRIQTPAGTDIKLAVAGRTWINGAGQWNMPDGEVFTAPIEDATEGTVRFDFPSLRSGREVRGVRLEFRAGRVVEAVADQGQDFLLRMLDQGPGARVLGEVGLGCNYALTHTTGHAMLDEKIGGTFHLALGASYPETGGVNRSGLHWDLVGDLRPGGRLEADGRLISANGRFQDPQWPQPE